jgi:hypothetical protein
VDVGCFGGSSLLVVGWLVRWFWLIRIGASDLMAAVFVLVLFSPLWWEVMDDGCSKSRRGACRKKVCVGCWRVKKFGAKSEDTCTG